MWFDYGYSPFGLLPAWLRGARLTLDWPQFAGKDVVLTHFSRIGIAVAYKLLSLAPGDEVLVPSYNCGSEIDPLLWCGAQPVFYRVDSHAMIDTEDIQARATPITRAVYVTHYFGWPQGVAELAKWCRERKLLLIEDCALSLFSEGPEGPVGCIGDAAIHCFWKMLPVPDGGALCLPERSLEGEVKLRSPSLGSVFRKTRPFLQTWLENEGKRHLGPLYDLARAVRRKSVGETPIRSQEEEQPTAPEMPADCYFDDKMKDWGISRLARGIMNRIDPIKIVTARRHNYELLLAGIQDLPGVKPLFDDLPVGVCPLVLPVLVSDPHYWQRSLNERGVFPFRWWRGYHRDFSWEGFPEACKLKNHLMAFQVHQHVTEDQIAHAVRSVRAVSLGNR